MGYSLRISVIDNCQLRCGYCLPDGKLNPLKKHQWLSIAQYQKVAEALWHLPIDRIRFTGGEPLLRKDLPAIIAVFAKKFAVPLAVTTNGLRFITMQSDLVGAGLSAVTFHLDTLKQEKYPLLMGQGEVATVINAMKAAQDAGLLVKINVVVQKGLNDDELVDFLFFSKTHDVEIRFIEQMNTGSARKFVAETFMSGREILDRCARSTNVIELSRRHRSAPAERFLAEDIGVEFGLIASDTRPFCDNCDRLRLSANGRMRSCLYEPMGQSLELETLSDEELMRHIKATVAAKRSFHPALKSMRADFSMADVGG